MNDRLQRVVDYYQRHGNQQKWYSQRAIDNKRQFEWIGILVVVLAVAAGFVPVLGLDGPSPIGLSEKIASFLSALIVVLKGIERIWLPEEKWKSFRKASESLKRETELYVEGIYPYEAGLGEEELFKLYIKRCCLIKAEEQNNYWGFKSDPNGNINSEEPKQNAAK